MTEPSTVILYGKAECHLCEQAEAVLAPVAATLGVAYRKVDITSAPDLFDRLRYRIPVIEVPGGQTLDWPTTAERVRRAILAASSAR